jgi:hypothetical protein
VNGDALDEPGVVEVRNDPVTDTTRRPDDVHPRGHAVPEFESLDSEEVEQFEVMGHQVMGIWVRELEMIEELLGADRDLKAHRSIVAGVVPIAGQSWYFPEPRGRVES